LLGTNVFIADLGLQLVYMNARARDTRKSVEPELIQHFGVSTIAQATKAATEDITKTVSAVEAGSELLGAASGLAASMRDLGTELNIKAPSLYSHFPSKDAILQATVVSFVTRLEALCEAAPAAPVFQAERHDWLADAVRLIADQPLQLQLIVNDRTLIRHSELGPRLAGIRKAGVEILKRFGVREERRAVAITGAPIFTLLTESCPTDDVDVLVRMIETFIDAR
jgi:AcrR family transcriptional regulator